MKYLKHFEENNRFHDDGGENGKFYWCVDAEPRRFRKELEKIGCPWYTIKGYLRDWPPFPKSDEKFWFISVLSQTGFNSWNLSKVGLESAGYEYKGPILLSRQELDEIEAQEKMEKYNL